MEFVKKNRFLDVKLELQISYSDAFSLILRTVPMSVYQCQSFWFLQFDGKFEHKKLHFVLVFNHMQKFGAHKHF